MKSIKYLFAVAALTCALTLSAKADLQFLSAVDFGNGPNDPGTNHDVLVDFLGFDPGTLNHNYEDLNESPNVAHDVFPGEYFVVHYGKGPGGTGHGGSWEFFKVINGEVPDRHGWLTYVYPEESSLRERPKAVASTGR